MNNETFAKSRKMKVAQEFCRLSCSQFRPTKETSLGRFKFDESARQLMRVRAFSFCLAWTSYPGRCLLGIFSDREMQMRPTYQTPQKVLAVRIKQIPHGPKAQKGTLTLRFVSAHYITIRSKLQPPFLWIKYYILLTKPI